MILYYMERIIPAVIVLAVQGILLAILRKCMKKKWKKPWFLKSQAGALLIMLFAVLFGYFGKYVSIADAPTKQYTVQELKEDLNQLEKVLFGQSPMYYTDREALREAFDQVKKQIIEPMTEEDYYRLINPLVVQVRCGHTNLSISQALQKSREGKDIFFPIAVSLQKDCIMVKETNTEYGIEEGDTIQSINGVEAADIIQTIVDNISRDGDNEAVAQYIANACFQVKYHDFVDQSHMYDVVLEKKDGTIVSKQVEAIWNKEWNTNAWDLHKEMYTDGDYYSSTFEKDSATLRIRVFFEEKTKFKTFLKEFFSEVEERGITKVILDVRGNFGGDAKMAKELLSYLITEPYSYFESKLPLTMKLLGYGKTVKPKQTSIKYETELWIDGGCFSTCGHFAAVYKSLGLGKVIGKPTGGGSTCTDGSSDVVLHNTGIRLHYATTVFSVRADLGKENMVCPD